MKPDNLEEKQSEMIARNQEKKSKKKASRPKKEKLPRRSRATLQTLIREAIIAAKSDKCKVILIVYLAKLQGIDLPLPAAFWESRNELEQESPTRTDASEEFKREFRKKLSEETGGQIIPVGG